MNYLEFKRQLMVDPYSTDPAFLAAKEQDEQFVQAADEADEFERLLQSAVNVEVPPGLAEQIMLRTSIEEGLRTDAGPSPAAVARPVWPQALAAGLFAAAITAGVMNWQQPEPPVLEPASMETFVVEHWQNHGLAAVQTANTEFSSPEDLKLVLAAVGVEANQDFLKQVRYGKNCPTPKGEGAHLVIATEHGHVTLFYAPQVDSESRRLSIDDVVAILVKMETGSAALVGEYESEESIREIGDMINENLRPMSTST